jgi:hypothetical protein
MTDHPKPQCSNCNSFKVIIDTRTKFITYGLTMLIPGLLFYYLIMKSDVISIFFMLASITLILAGLIYLIKSLLIKRTTYFCKSCHNKWT